MEEDILDIFLKRWIQLSRPERAIYYLREWEWGKIAPFESLKLVKAYRELVEKMSDSEYEEFLAYKRRLEVELGY